MPCRRRRIQARNSPGRKPGLFLPFSGADDETRTRDIHLGKVMLYQLSYIRMRFNTLAVARASTTHRPDFGQVSRVRTIAAMR